MLIVVLASLRARWTGLLGSFTALALGVGLLAAMCVGLAATADAPVRAAERFAGAPVVVMGTDTLTVEVERGPTTARISQRLAHPQPVDIELLRGLRALGPWRRTADRTRSASPPTPKRCGPSSATARRSSPATSAGAPTPGPSGTPKRS